MFCFDDTGIHSGCDRQDCFGFTACAIPLKYPSHSNVIFRKVFYYYSKRVSMVEVIFTAFKYSKVIEIFEIERQPPPPPQKIRAFINSSDNNELANLGCRYIVRVPLVFQDEPTDDPKNSGI